MITIRIPTPLRSMTGGKGEIEGQGASIAEVIEQMNVAYPGIKDRICDERGELRRFINIYLNEEDIRFLTGKDTPVKDGDAVSIVPAIAGGSHD